MRDSYTFQEAVHMNRKARRALGAMNKTKIPGVTMPFISPKREAKRLKALQRDANTPGTNK